MMTRLDLAIEDKPLAPAMPVVPPLALLDNACLFLDFDGTLVEIAPHPDAVLVGPPLLGLLGRLAARLPGRLGIISGRPISQLQHYLGETAPMLAGSHGAEIRWPDGSCSGAKRPDELGAVLEEMIRFQEAHPGVLIERKPFGAAIHYRGAPQDEAACRELATALARSSGLVLQAGKMVFELRAAGADKGDAVRTLMGGAGAQCCRPIFIGDDDTDETAFVAVAELGGAGILVGPQRATSALYRLDDVTATLAWLGAACRDAR